MTEPSDEKPDVVPEVVERRSSALRLDQVEHPTGAVVLHAVGEIDTDTAPELGAEVGVWCDTAPQVLLDLSGVTFLGSAGLSVLLETRDMIEDGTRFQLRCGSSRAVRRALQVTGTMELFDVVDRIPEESDAPARALFSVPDPR
ncbi:STAS domain-containing protein [Pseudonocardia endophytica]|uniref:Anti-sigma factor antagonist n=1 Tax=Pseudonocardia endophytica TaxID=401976 RepID=A0A4R1HQM2_PSEEN|nr:STAS domain-containing protein [Pseudonocardia endophytica]TCK24418.1 anti-anti-sigma factor [Pseudonocardia endophytica]